MYQTHADATTEMLKKMALYLQLRENRLMMTKVLLEQALALSFAFFVASVVGVSSCR